MEFHKEALHWLSQAAVAGHALRNIIWRLVNSMVILVKISRIIVDVDEVIKEAGFGPAVEILKVISDELNDQQFIESTKIIS